MSENKNIRTDSIDLLVTKEDFIELMDDNGKLIDRIKELEAELRERDNGR